MLIVLIDQGRVDTLLALPLGLSPSGISLMHKKQCSPRTMPDTIATRIRERFLVRHKGKIGMAASQWESASLRVGLIGLGKVGAIHLRCFQRHPDINLSAVVEPSQDRVEELGLSDDCPVFSSVEALLAASVVDVACVATPVSTHEAVVAACAEYGVHVLCEKPLAITRASAQHMLKVCASAGVQLGYAASYRFLPALIRARQIIQEGTLGEVRVLQERAIGGAAAGCGVPMGFIHYPKGGPGGTGMGLVDHGIHFIDIFPWLLASTITRVEGRGNISGAPRQTEWMLMEFENGAVGSLLYNDSVYGTGLPSEGLFTAGSGWDIEAGYAESGQWSSSPGCIEVSGTCGALRIYHYAQRLFLKTEAGVSEVPIYGAPPPQHFTQQMLSFLQAIERREPPPVSGEDGFRALQHLLDVY